jgi:hypothetical protein
MKDLNPKSPDWVRSSYSGNGGQCVEYAPGYAEALGVVPVRDSKKPGRAIRISAAGWASFVTAVKHGEMPTPTP